MSHETQEASDVLESEVVVSDQPIELFAEHTGVLKIGDHELPCFVLNNKKRVIIMREVVYLLTGNRKGGLERYTNATGVREHMPPKFVGQRHRDTAIVFRAGSSVAYGYEADDIIGICDAYLRARETGTLHPGQTDLAIQAEIFIRACAKIGLTALIDEATGYQAVRDADELQVKLAAYISKDLNEWTRTFPVEFFELLYQLEGQHPPVPPKPYPKRFGRYVMQFVYDTLDPDVADWLRENNPKPQGANHHHQWLTKEFGQPKLKQHLSEVIGIMKVSKTIEVLRENLARAFADNRQRRRQRLQYEKRRKTLIEQEALDQETGQLTLFDEIHPI